MPNIEPAIDAQLKWENPNMENGRKTLPIGPMKWEEGQNGEMQAWGVGNENGTQRKKLIFTIPKPVGYKDGDVIPPTPAQQIGDPLTTVGTATHPPDTNQADIGTPPSDSDSRNSAEATKDFPTREGTSEAKYIQQNLTHASGQLADGTPHAAVNNHGHGDKTVTMEPNTIGQAPKEVPLPEREEPAPGYLDQAKQAAAAASSVVASTATQAADAVKEAVSGGQVEEQKPAEPVRVRSPQEQEMDRKIDEAKTQDVEAFLRAQNSSNTSGKTM
jgi:hypothetical protein